MRMDARRATKVVAGTTKPRSATMQTPHFAATWIGRLPRHGQRSLGCGSGSNSAPFYGDSCSSLRPFPHHAARDRVRGAFRAICFVSRLAKGASPLAAPRFAHPIPESRRRNRVGLNQRFHKRRYGRIGYSRGWKIRTRKSGELCLQPEERRGFLAAIETHKLPCLGIGKQAAQ